MTAIPGTLHGMLGRRQRQVGPTAGVATLVLHDGDENSLDELGETVTSG